MNDSLAQKLIAFVAGGAAALWATLPQGMHALLLFMVADIVTGIACGFRGHRFASSIFGAGFYRKVAELGIAFTALVLQAKLGMQAEIVAFVMWGLVAKEIASILENAKALGLDTSALRPLFDRMLTDRIPKGGARANTTEPEKPDGE